MAPDYRHLRRAVQRPGMIVTTQLYPNGMIVTRGYDFAKRPSAASARSILIIGMTKDCLDHARDYFTKAIDALNARLDDEAKRLKPRLDQIVNVYNSKFRGL